MIIRQLSIRRFRGIEALTWRPAPGLNCLIGPADSGKSTLLAAINLLLAPRPATQASEFDYRNRQVANGFEIEAVIGALSDECQAALRVPPFWGWVDGRVVDLPDADGQAEPVLRVRARGTPDLEVVHEFVPPHEEPAEPFTVAHRRRMLLSAVSNDELGARDLRLGAGGLLDRHLGHDGVRAQVQRAVSAASVRLEPPERMRAALDRLEARFADSGLPDDLHLAVMPPHGTSLVGMVALVAGEDPATAVPLVCSGTGTRRMALLQLAAALIDGVPIVTADEPERGLEPYRQRALMAQLRSLVGDTGQAFVTTHAPAVLGCAADAAVWRCRRGAEPARVNGPVLARLMRDDPESLLARIPVICEGKTEIGVLSVLVPHLFNVDIDQEGYRLVDGRGQRGAIDTATALADQGIACGAFLDNEDFDQGRRQRLLDRRDVAAGAWTEVRNIEEAVAQWLPFEQLDAVVNLAGEITGQPDGRHQFAQIRTALGDNAPTLQDARERHGETAVRRAVAQAMGDGKWFKDEFGARELARKLIALGVPDRIAATIRAFWTRVAALG